MFLLFKQTSSSTVSYQFFNIDDVQFIIILIFSDRALEIGDPSTALFNLFAQFRYPADCSNVDACKKAFKQRLKSTISTSRILNIEVPLTDGQILNFRASMRDLVDPYQEGEYESDVNFLGKD